MLWSTLHRHIITQVLSAGSSPTALNHDFLASKHSEREATFSFKIMTEPHYFSKLQSAFGFGQICPCPGLHKQAGRGSLEPQCATKNWAGKDGTGKLMVESDESCFQVRCHLHWSHLVQTQPTQPTQLTQPAPAMQKAATCCIFFGKGRMQLPCARLSLW